MPHHDCEKATFTLDALGDRTNLSTRTVGSSTWREAKDVLASSKSDPKTIEIVANEEKINDSRSVTRELENDEETGEGSSRSKIDHLVTNHKQTTTERTDDCTAGTTQCSFTINGYTEETRVSHVQQEKHHTLTNHVTTLASYTSRNENTFDALAIETTRLRATTATGWTEDAGRSVATRHTKSVATVTREPGLPRAETTTVEDTHQVEIIAQETKHGPYSLFYGGEKTDTYRSRSEDTGSSRFSTSRLTIAGGAIVVGGSYDNQSQSRRAVETTQSSTYAYEDNNDVLCSGHSEAAIETIAQSGSTDKGTILPLGFTVGKRTSFRQETTKAKDEWWQYGWWGSKYEGDPPVYVDEVYGTTRYRESWSDTSRWDTTTDYGLGVSTATTGQRVEHYLADFGLFNNLGYNPYATRETGEILRRTDARTQQPSVLVNEHWYSADPEVESYTASEINTNLADRPDLADAVFSDLATIDDFFSPATFVAIPPAGGAGASGLGTGGSSSSGSSPPTMPAALRAQSPPAASPLDAKAKGGDKGKGEGTSDEPETITLTEFNSATLQISPGSFAGNSGSGFVGLGTTPPPGDYLPVAMEDGFSVARRMSGEGPLFIFSRVEGGTRYYYVRDPNSGMLTRYRPGATVVSVTPNGGFWGDYDDAVARGLYKPGRGTRAAVFVFKIFCPSCDPSYTIQYSDGYSYTQLGGGPSQGDMLNQGLAVTGTANLVNSATRRLAGAAAENAAGGATSTALVPKSAVELGKWGEARLAADLGYQGVKPASAFKTSGRAPFFVPGVMRVRFGKRVKG